MAWNWYDFVFLPWTINKYAWEQYKKSQEKPQEPGRPPQISCYGRALPVVFGKTRLSGNIIWLGANYGAYTPWTGRFVVDARDHMLALCEGPITGVARMWLDKNIASGPGPYFSIYTGTRPTQTAWGQSGGGLGYPGVAMAVATWPTAVMSSPAQVSFEVKGLLYATGDATNGDADPSQIVDVIVRDKVAAGSAFNLGVGAPFGVTVSTGRDGSAASSYARYVKAQGLWLSPAFTDRRPAAEHLKDVLEASNATCLWTSGVLEIVPLGDTEVTGNSVTYTPALTIQYALNTTTNDFIARGSDDPVTMELPAESDTFNVCPVEFLDRAPTAAGTDPAHAYNVAIEQDPDPVDVFGVRGERKAPTVTMHAICKRDVALTISRIRAQQLVRARVRYKFKLPWRFCRLEPLDFVSLTEPLLGLNAVPVRIESVEEDENGELSIEAVEWPFGIGSAIAHTTASSDGATYGWAAGPEARIREMAARNWTAQANLPGSGHHGINWNGTIFVAIGNGSYATSPDGVTWTSRTGPAINLYGITWNGSLFCAVGASCCATSPDGITWTSRTIPAGTYRCIEWNGSVFAALGDSGVCATSPDGITWTSRTTPASRNYKGVAWNGTVFLAVGNTTPTPQYAATSPDGTTWTERTTPISNYTAVVWNGSVFCVVGASCAVTADGITWTAATTVPPIGTFFAVGWDGAVFVGVGAPDKGSTSRDGLTWTVFDNPLSGNYLSVAWSGRRFVAIGDSSNVATSLAV